MKWYLAIVATVHVVFMMAELFPWPSPFLLKKASGKLPPLPDGQPWTKFQKPVVATIVHNAGIYNAILAGGLFWAAWTGQSASDVAAVLLVGATVAGVFGTLTLRSWPTAIQALLGVGGLVLLSRVAETVSTTAGIG
jgi:uncharacterized membrane protein